MAARDVEFYFYLKEALKEKLRHPDIESFRLGKYNFDYDYIFDQARRVFPQKYHFNHTYLNGVSIAQLYDEHKTAELNQLNMEFAQDLVNGFGGLDERNINRQNLDPTLIEYENDLTAPEEPDSFYKELENNQLPLSQKAEPEEIEPGQQSNQEESSQTQQSQRAREEPRRVIIQKPEKPQYGMTKEEYAKYKEEHKEERSERARQLWAERKAAREASEKDEEEKKKGLKRPGENQAAGKTPLGNKLDNWIKNKFNNSRIGKAFNNSRLGRGLNRFNNLLDAPNRFLSRLGNRFLENTNLGRGLTRINNLLNAPSRFLSRLSSNLGRLAGNTLRNIGSQAARLALNGATRILANLGSQAAGTAARSIGSGIVRAAGAIGLSGLLFAIFIGLAIFLIWNLYDANSECEQPGTVEMTKSANKESYSVGEKIDYRIQVVYRLKCNRAYAAGTVRDTIPANTTYVPNSAKSSASHSIGFLSADAPGPDGRLDGNTLIWQLGHMTPNEANTLTFSVTADQEDVWIANQATISFRTYTSGVSGGDVLPITGLLPNTPAPPDWENTRVEIIAAFNKHPELIEIYKQASAQTGVPWQLLAGLHFVETGSGPGPDSSLVSGRKIGQVEPDITPAKCASGVTGPGIPIPIGSGCGFSNQLDSVIYAANHLAEKIGKTPSTFAEAVKALSRYNGGGNANCGEGLPYGPCPPEFEGQDDPYAMADFDAAHSSDKMYIIFCGDKTRCSPPRIFGRPGAMGVVRALAEEGL